MVKTNPASHMIHYGAEGSRAWAEGFAGAFAVSGFPRSALRGFGVVGQGDPGPL